MRRLLCVGTMVMLVMGVAGAAPITMGTYLPVPAVPNNLGEEPWSHRSFDCLTCNLGYELQKMGLYEGTYLHAPFRFPGWAGTSIFSWTAFSNVITIQNDGEFVLTNPTGMTFRSNGDGWEHFALIKKPLDAEHTRWIGCFEDWFDDDCQDEVQLYVEYTPLLTPPPETTPIPEPSTWMLIAMAAAGARRRATHRRNLEQKRQ